MDWSRAKSIMIAMFLIINIFLTYQLITISRNQYNYIDQEELQSVMTYLNKKNVQVKAEIPDRVWIAPSVKVKYQLFNAKTLGEIFFNDDDYELKGSTDTFEISKGDLSLKVRDRRYLNYSNRGIQIQETAEIDEDKCLNNAYSFISKLRLNYNHRYVKQKQVGPGYVHLILGQQYSNIPVEESEIEIIATEEGVVQAKIIWFDWIRPDKKYNITTPVVAMLTAFGQRGGDEKAVEVKQIRLGYYFNTELVDSEEYATLEGTIAPMWVILSDQNEIYINAYNENIEKTRSYNLP